jgi:hypothetical protein
MTASAIDLCNSALTLLGQPTIVSLTANLRSARLVNQRYPYCIDATLRAYPWNCALERATLTADGTAPDHGFALRYALPTYPYCLRVLSMQDTDCVFKIEGRYLLTDEPEARILYVARIPVGSLDALLFEAAVARLAADIAYPLTNSNSMADQAWKAYKDKLMEAQDIDAQEGSSDQTEADDWLLSRR